MPSNNSKYTQEVRERTAKYILENGRTATSVAEEKGIVRKQPQPEGELLYRIKELERELKKKEKDGSCSFLRWNRD